MTYAGPMTTTSAPTETLPLVEQLRSRHRNSQLPDRKRRREIREAVGATVRDVAAAVGVSNFAVCSWEKPDGTIEPKLVHRIAYKRVLDALERLAEELATDRDRATAA
jgi:predicted transcriptional regulator